MDEIDERILALLIDGRTHAEIAGEVYLGVSAVDHRVSLKILPHFRNCLDDDGIRRTVDLVRVALRLGVPVLETALFAIAALAGIAAWPQLWPW